jgi:murein DD-endopeptidase MepM/ murein hydrolase activator NlpD
VKDIIAAQQIQRRTSSSLLTSASKFRVIPDNSFIAEQQLPKRKKNPILEKIETLRKRQSASFTLPFFKRENKRENVIRGKPCQGLTGTPYLESLLKENAPMNWHPQKISTGINGLFTHTKVIVLCLLFCLGAGFPAVLVINYIPSPEPPQEAKAERIINQTSSLAAANSVEDEIPLDLTESFAWQTYKVASGDTVEGIARRFGLSMDAVIASNNLRNVRAMRSGEKLRIPNMDGIPYTVKSGDSYAKIAAAQGVPIEAILDANEIQSDEIRSGTVLFIPGAKMDKADLRRALGSFFIWPLTGKLSSGFGWRYDPFTSLRSFHAGLDISVPMGSPVKVATDGRVSSMGYNSVYGNFLIVTHAENYQTMYAHLSRITVKNGVAVNQGTIIARSGNSGRSTGPHLHFAVYKNGRAINPLEIFKN